MLHAQRKRHANPNGTILALATTAPRDPHALDVKSPRASGARKFLRKFT